VTTGYEAFFGLGERPFSLTPDPKYFFKSRVHGSVREILEHGLARNERFLLVTGDLGVGKTSLCRTLVPTLRRSQAVSFIANPLLTPSGLFRLLLEDFGAVTSEEARRNELAGATPNELREMLVKFLASSRTQGTRAVIVIDEAQTLPLSIVEHLLLLGALDGESDRRLQLVLVGQPLLGEPGATGVRALNQHASTKAQLVPLGRDECGEYVAHRLTVAGGESTLFSTHAIDTLFVLSGGLPRLMNLLAERALQDAATHRVRRVGAGSVEAAATSLELLRVTPRRFRWFTRRVS
jgi:general secretion pathway protein A